MSEKYGENKQIMKFSFILPSRNEFFDIVQIVHNVFEQIIHISISVCQQTVDYCIKMASACDVADTHESRCLDNGGRIEE
jgi:hypothetical protein